MADVQPSGVNSAASGSRASLGLYLPPGWNTNFLSKLPNATVAIVGDSLGQGYYSSDLTAKGWAQLLTAALQAAYGDGGSGYKSASMCAAFATAASVPAGAQTQYATRGYATQAGTWARNLAAGQGPGGNVAMTTVDIGTPAAMTHTVRGTTVKIFTQSNGGANAAWTYQIDGGAVVPVADAAGANIVVTTITGLATGNHTVKVTYNDAGVKTLWFIGVAGENAAGLRVNNYSVFGMQATGPGQLTAFTDLSVTPDWMGGYAYPADLAIYTMGANDANAGTATEAYIGLVRRWLKAVRDGGNTPLSGAISLAVVAPHIGQYDATTRLWQDYLTYLRGVCEAYGAALIDFWSLGKGSWNYWNGLTNWSNTTAPSAGSSGTDTIHPSDQGHALMESVILPTILTVV